MKKIVIPTIVLATVLLAGFITLMPVERANAVHTTILAATTDVVVDTVDEDGDIDNDSTLRVTSTQPFCIMSLYVADTDATVEAADSWNFDVVDIDDNEVILEEDGTELSNLHDPDTNGDDLGFEVLSLIGSSDDEIGDGAICGSAEIDFDIVGTGDLTNDVVDARVVVLTASSATVAVDFIDAND